MLLCGKCTATKKTKQKTEQNKKKTNKQTKQKQTNKQNKKTHAEQLGIRRYIKVVLKAK